MPRVCSTMLRPQFLQTSSRMAASLRSGVGIAPPAQLWGEPMRSCMRSSFPHSPFAPARKCLRRGSESRDSLCVQALESKSVPRLEDTNPVTYDDATDKWSVKMLYDGDCPLCMREVDMLRERNRIYRAIKFVDISAPDYSPEENAGVDFATAMGRIHAILPDGTILYDIMAFKKLYEEVGLGWVYAFTRNQPLAKIADAIYSIWARYRLPITGRPPLVQILEERKRKEEECSRDNCRVD
ncbi:hypothetical protein KP509_24G080200 [Ceratopteris richardii]|uniref:Thiol-disulfide oxidoreductase DCC n=1 Tax=Ceratopteris richardii TaxID=49495 RepID=A0A8T2RWT1_CERRI|nr:hypothetical protein KP509_24G080200 [Ceratopteris richardii]